ncbi:hypothetical protein C0J52_01653 [Blattella germanica]|nr:hypothetical protein C0J52_01653 [Blattella germanica]
MLLALFGAQVFSDCHVGWTRPGIVVEFTIPLRIMWCLQCCPCWKSSEAENSGLLSSPQWQSKGTDTTKEQQYTVRRISSFGRAGSGDDISDNGRDQGDVIQSPAEFWTPKIQRIQPGAIDEDCTEDSTDASQSPRPPCKPAPTHRGRWRKAFHPFKPHKTSSRSQNWRECGLAQLPPITVSTPDLQGDAQEEDSPPASPTLRHAGTMTNMSSVSVIQSPNKWFKSHSMQDINRATQLANEKKELVAILSTPREDAARIARNYGLDTSLYAPNQIKEYSPMSRSNEALNAWRSPANSDKLNLYQELSCGMIHFCASYYQKNKRLLVNVDKIDGLPPKGDHYVYSIIVKLTILPQEKPVRVSKIVKNDLNPVIEEDFEFYIKDLFGKVLRLSVHDADHLGKYDAVGNALFYLEDIIAGRPRHYTMKLYKQSQKTKSRKTAVVSNSRNPTYNQTFSFKLSANFLHDSMIVLSVMLKGLLKKDVPIGRLVLGPFHYAEEREKTPWGRALIDQEEVDHWFRMYL